MMGKQTEIEWTDSTWNPWTGCIKVSAGCKFCYMYREQSHYGNDPTIIKRTSKTTFNAPLRWKNPGKVFTCSWSDFFIDQADEWRNDAWAIIKQTPHLIYQILTKRPENIASRLPADWGTGGWANVWLGVTIENRDCLNRANTLAAIPARVRFISYEPALELVDFSDVLPNFDWLISGGESGSNPRPALPHWFSLVRMMCAQYGVAYFHKQNGGKTKINGAYGGNELNGAIYQEMPTLF